MPQLRPRDCNKGCRHVLLPPCAAVDGSAWGQLAEYEAAERESKAMRGDAKSVAKQLEDSVAQVERLQIEVFEPCPHHTELAAAGRDRQQSRQGPKISKRS